MHPCFCSGIVHLPELGSLTIDRRDINNTAILLTNHRIDNLAATVKYTGKVCGNDFMPLVGRHLAKCPIAGNACIIDQDIYGTMICFNSTYHLPYFLVAAYVCFVQLKIITFSGHFLFPGFSLFFRAVIGANDITIITQAFTDMRSQSAGSPGY
ncbi:hypothetical protein D3C86_1250730 [compost metagenome]